MACLLIVSRIFYASEAQDLLYTIMMDDGRLSWKTNPDSHRFHCSWTCQPHGMAYA